MVKFTDAHFTGHWLCVHVVLMSDRRFRTLLLPHERPHGWPGKDSCMDRKGIAASWTIRLRNWPVWKKGEKTSTGQDVTRTHERRSSESRTLRQGGVYVHDTFHARQYCVEVMFTHKRFFGLYVFTSKTKGTPGIGGKERSKENDRRAWRCQRFSRTQLQIFKWTDLLTCSAKRWRHRIK